MDSLNGQSVWMACMDSQHGQSIWTACVDSLWDSLHGEPVWTINTDSQQLLLLGAITFVSFTFRSGTGEEMLACLR